MMAQPCVSSSPGLRRRSDGSVRESLFFPVYERNEQERLEALVRRRAGGVGRRGGGGGGEATRDHLDNRPKRWTWGGPPDGVEGDPKTPSCRAIGSCRSNEPPTASSVPPSHNAGDFLPPPTSDQPINRQLSSSSAALHSPERVSTRRAASPNNNNRTKRNTSNRRSIAGFPEDPSKVKTPTGEFPNTPARSSSFRANSKGPATPKRVRNNRSRAQSPCSPGQFTPSSRQRATTPDDRSHGTLEKKIPKSTSRELNAESPGMNTGRSVGGTTDAEEASRLLAERRRLARIQKEQEEIQRMEEEKLRAEEEQRRQQEAREQQEREARQTEEDRVKREEQRRIKEEEERRQKEQRWKDMQEKLDKEREEAVLRGQKETERKRVEREQQHFQEEQERLLRKKRIDEIMKRTRKSEVDPPTAASEASLEAAVEEHESSPAQAPVILLGPLETKSCLEELSDGVQSMDVSPVSRDELASGQDFSPVTEGGYPLLMDLDHGQEETSYPKLQAGSGVGDLNKNLLIRAYAAAEAAQMIPSEVDV